MDVLVVVPTYNEIHSLEGVVTGILDQGAGVLVVDDASPDGTGELADLLSQQHGGVSVLHRTVKAGLGRAYADGFRRALETGTSIVCQMDADGSHDPAQLKRLIDAIDGGADLAIGSRFVSGGGFVRSTTSRRLFSRAANLYSGVALGLRVRDATSGFRAFRRETLLAIDPTTAASLGYAFQIEMAWRARKAAAAIVEVPIQFRPRTAGTSKLDLKNAAEALTLVTRWGLSRAVPGSSGPRK
jgi:dolichol-phosphate mannosyltransferase